MAVTLLSLIPGTAAVLTLCACTPPLDEVLQLWDFLLAFGAHLNILCVVAQLLLMRDALMTSTRCVTPCVIYDTGSRLIQTIRLAP